MKSRLRRAVLLLLGAALVIAPTDDRKEKRTALPAKIPTPPEVKFTEREEGWPPRPVGRTEVTNVPYTTLVGALTESRQEEFRRAALQDTRVREALGERFGYITAAEVEPNKARRVRAGVPKPVRLTFYSYSNNVAVEVFMGGQKVQKVNRRANYQPPEGVEEIKMAISLAEKDSRLRESVQGMRATAIVTYPERGQPGYEHRVLHVSFSASDQEVPRYYALVDLTGQTVLTAGQIPER